MIRESNSRSWPAAGICALLVMLVFIVFGQTLGHDFVNYDDGATVYEAPRVTAGISLPGIAWAFTHSQVGHWDPLTTLSHMLDCQLYGLHPWGHHLGNVLLHAAAVVLLFVALWEMTGSMWRSGFVAAVFAIHPLRVESVAWVSERKDVLSGVFFMLILMAYLRYVRRPRSRLRYWTVAALFILGLMSKSMLVTLPFVLLLLDYWPLNRFQTRPDSASPPSAWPLIVEKIPLLLLSILFAVAQMAADRGGLISLEKTTLPQRLGNAVVSYAVYLRQMVWPADLAVFYPYPKGGVEPWKVAIALAVLCAVTAAVIFVRKKQPWLLVGWLWYLGMLVPVIGIVQSGDLAHADRYTYLPMIGVCIAGTWTVAEWSEKWPWRRMAAGTVAFVILCTLLLAAYRQATYWRDNETLWTHALECTRDNSVAHNDLGNALLHDQRTDEAIAQYLDALRIDPALAEAHYNLGNALDRQGRAQDAIAQYRDALRINPAYADACYNLGNTLLRQGRSVEAAAQFRKALSIDPAYAGAHASLGNILLQQGRADDAIAEYREALRLDPALAETHNNLGSALLQQGQTDGAIAEYRQALRIDSAYAKAHNNLGTALLRQGRAGDAIVEYREAVRINPTDAPARVNLAAAYAQAGQFSDAVNTAEGALQLAQTQSNTALVSALQREIRLYEAATPFRDGQ